MTKWEKLGGTNLAVVAGKVEVVQCVVSGSVDDVDKRVASDHVRVVNLRKIV